MDVAIPYRVRSAGLIDRQTYHSTPGTRQGDVMLTVFLDGRGWYRNNVTQMAVGGGMVGLVPHEDPGILMADKADPYVHFYCRFAGDYALHAAREILRTKVQRFFAVPNADEIADCIDRMGRFRRAMLPDRVGRPEVLLAQALMLLAGEIDRPSTPTLTAASINEYLRERISQPTDLPSMAEHFCVSVTTLCRASRRLSGTTVQRMHEALKVDWAKVLLDTGVLNVAEVALRVGYSDPFYFSRVFRARTGVAPKAWRRR